MGNVPKFALGRIVATRNAADSLPADEVAASIRRHVGGDWGDLCEEDWKANEEALEHGARLLSVYWSSDRVKFYIITERDRSVTTVLLPEDY